MSGMTMGDGGSVVVVVVVVVVVCDTRLHVQQY